MGMGIGSSSAGWASQGPSSLQSSSVSNWQHKQSGLKALNSALQSGDLASAQSAYSAISANNPNISSSSPLGQIGAALQSGDIAGAQKLASSMHTGRMHGHGGDDVDGNQNSANSVANATGTAFLSAFLGAISPAASTTPTSSTGASDPTSSSSNPLGTSLSGVASPSVNQITQDVTSFLQNLFTTLGQGSANTVGTSPSTNAPSIASGATSAIGTSASTGNSATLPTQPYNPGFQQGYGGAINQLSNNLQALISQLEGASSSASSSTSTASSVSTSTTSTSQTDATAGSMASSGSTPTTTATTISQLQQSFGTLISDAGGTATNSSLTSFLQNFEQNLQNNGATGNLINMQA